MILFQLTWTGFTFSQGCVTSYGCTAVAFSELLSRSGFCDSLASQLHFRHCSVVFVFEGFDVCKQLYFFNCYLRTTGQHIYFYKLQVESLKYSHTCQSSVVQVHIRLFSAFMLQCVAFVCLLTDVFMFFLLFLRKL